MKRQQTVSHIKRIHFLYALTVLFLACWHIQIHTKEQRKWTFIVYMAAVNDLRSFAALNIKQMTQIGSNDTIAIVVHLDILASGNKKVTRRYYIENGRVIQMNAQDPDTQQMDSGDPQTLISCCQWAMSNWPAEHYCLVCWNHGTGPIDSGLSKIANTNELFIFNPITNTLDLDRRIGYIDYISYATQRGICWDDITGNYLTNQKLDFALREICNTCLGGNKIDIVAFDACLMMGIEIADLLEPHANIMLGSQEVELGTGWRYDYVLEPFQHGSLSPQEFAAHCVHMYKKNYNGVTNDYTQSAVDLNQLAELKHIVDHISSLLTSCLSKQKDKSVKKAIKASRSKKITTTFDEPTYIDLYHWYTNLQASVKHFALTSPQEEKTLKAALVDALEYARYIIKEMVIASVAGKNLSKAQGISIYFPEKTIHNSYKRTAFMQNNSWGDFLMSYLES